METTLQAILPGLTGARLVLADGARNGTPIAAFAFSGVGTDSRNVQAGSLFVALRGERFDAHDFLPQVQEQGVACVLLDHVPEGLTVPAIVVPDTRIALGELARHWRQRFSLPVIGVTGSNGKTTVKEMIASILLAAFGAERCLATRGNLNNDIGVPLTLFRLNGAHRAAVIELGMNHPGEIAALAAMAQPSVGLVNNAQREHQEFMASVAAVAQENGAVITGLPADGVAVFPFDDPFTPLWQDYAGSRRVVSFGLEDGVTQGVTCQYSAADFGSDMLVRLPGAGDAFPLRLAAAGVHNVRNALAAIAATHAIGIEAEAIIRGLQAFAPVNGRLQRKAAKNGAVVIDDTYNANPDSVRAAIDVLAQAAAPRILVLGDMGEVGNEGVQFHREIGAYARERGIDQLFTIGDLARHASAAFGPQAAHHAGQAIEDLQQALDANLSAHATVLIKGSRFMRMERLVQHLLDPKNPQALQETH